MKNQSSEKSWQLGNKMTTVYGKIVIFMGLKITKARKSVMFISFH